MSEAKIVTKFVQHALDNENSIIIEFHDFMSIEQTIQYCPKIIILFQNHDKFNHIDLNENSTKFRRRLGEEDTLNNL